MHRGVMGPKTGPWDMGHGHGTQDSAMGHRTYIMGHWARAHDTRPVSYGLVPVSYTHLTLPTICSV